MDTLFLLVIATLVCFGNCDFPCVCNTQPDRIVYGENHSVIIGHMKKYECKPVIKENVTDNWIAIAFYHQIGFINNTYTHTSELNTCQGDPSQIDALFTTERPTTTTTTLNPTTTATLQKSEATPLHIKTTNRPTMESTAVTTNQQATQISVGHVAVCPQLVQQFAIDDGNYLTISNNTCYELVTRLSNWNEAEANCKQKGGHLVHIESKAKQTFIFAFIVKNIGTYVDHSTWIGLHDQNQESHYQWVSGEPLTYTNFHNHGFAGIFQNHGIEDCIVMGADYNGEWDDRECDIGTYYHICQYPTVDSSTIHVTTPDPSVIQEGNIHLCSHSVQQDSTHYHGILGQYDHNCYELLPGQKSTWEHGETHCKTIGGHLAHISNAQEQDFIQRFMTEHYPTHAVWIGLNDKGTEGTFQWTSDGAAQYTNWIPGHLSNFVSHHEEDCVAFIPYKSGQWDDIPCGHRGFFGGDTGEMHPILCQYKTTEPGTLVGK